MGKGKEKAKEKKSKKPKRRFYKRKGFWIFILLCCIGGLIALKEVKKRLEPYRLQAAAIDISTIDDVEIPSIIVASDGSEIGRMFVENRSKISIEKIPQKLIDALLAQEDQRYWKHNGVDWTGVARAVYLNAKAGRQTQGASTITMQLARNAFGLKAAAEAKGQGGMERKIVEAFLALRIEEMMQEELAAEFPDEEERKKRMKMMVLEYYLNRIPFGSGFYGVRSAALGYFGKEPMDLSIEECASMVACVKNPTEISPLRNLVKNKKARDHVLNRMLAEEMITETEWIRMTSTPVKVNSKPLRRGKSHYYEIVNAEVLERVEIEAMSRGGFRIYTTIDRELQEKAHVELRKKLEKIEQMPGYEHPLYSDFSPAPGKVTPYLQGAVLMIDSETGNVLAHVGGRNYAHSQYDFVVNGARPFGTAFLPLIYAAAFSNGLHPATTVRDEPMDNRAVMIGGREGILGEWGMETLKPRHEGRITGRRAIAASKIAASVRLGRDLVGLEKVAAQARAFGFKIDSEKLFARMLLGSDAVSLPDAVRAYNAFSQQGKVVKSLRYIERIENVNGETVYQSTPTGKGSENYTQACDEICAYQIHDTLHDSLETGNLAEDGAVLGGESFPGVVKTGTMHNFTDGWCVGYNGQVSLGMWVGFHQGGSGAIYPEAFGRELAFEPWAAVMNAASARYLPKEIEQPEGLEPVTICSRSGLLATRYCYEPVEHEEHGVSFRYTGQVELLRVDRGKLGLCDVHGQGGIGTNEVLERYGPQAVDSAEQQRLAVSPIRPKAPVLIGEDPYNSEVLSLDEFDEEISIFVRGPTLSRNQTILGEGDASLRLSRPKKIEIKTD